jgi:uncharacterized protein YaaQ
MKMIIVIVKDHNADPVTQALTAENFRVTRVASTGGFLRAGVATLLIGVEDADVDAALRVMRANLGEGKPGEKRATVFVVPVEKFEQV